MKERIVFIINPISGKGKGKKLQPIIEDFFKEKDFEIITRFTEYEGHSFQIINEEIIENPSIIVACGGDGTINEVAQNLVGKSIPLGIIPIGSGNGLASNLKISKNFTKALEIILDKHICSIDVGVMNGKYFFSNLGFGIDATVIHRYSSQKKRNFIGYFKASIWSFLNFKPLSFQIEVDDVSLKNKQYFFILCSNSNEAGYGISFNPMAKLDDQKLDILCVEKLNLFEMFIFSISVLFNRIYKMKKAFIHQGESMTFISNKDSFIAQMDGEPVLISNNRAVVSLLPHALNVITPRVN